MAHPRPSRAFVGLQALEQRLLMSSAVIGGNVNTFIYNDANGDQVTITIKGPGTATITLQGNAIDSADVQSIVLADTTAASNLSIKVRKGRGDADGLTTIGSITGDTVGKLDMPDVSLVGDGLTLLGRAGSIRLSELQDGADLIMADSAGSFSLELQAIRGLNANHSQISLPGGLRKLRVREVAEYADLTLGDQAGQIDIDGEVLELSISVSEDLNKLRFGRNVNGLTLDVGQDLGQLDTRGSLSDVRGRVGRDLKQLQAKHVIDTRLQALRRIDRIKLTGNVSADTILAASFSIKQLDIRGTVQDTRILAGTTLDNDLALTNATFDVGVIDKVNIRDDVTDSVIAAGGDPGADRLFSDGEFLAGGRIDNLTIRGRLVGTLNATDPNPGIYADELGKVKFDGKFGTAVI